MKVIRATKEHIPLITPLFDAYRVFYEQASDNEGAKSFLEKRLEFNESVVFLAMDGDIAVGFTQLYMTFSSVSMESFYILNDLYVIPSYRTKGIGKALLNKAKEQCILMNYKGVGLETASNNPAQHLYERLGWEKDINHFHYFWTASKHE
ncbi:GNAT family N-acetyltransferase [uncultured Croceitalea sp.]|uniref:GNAT family N-acetyltransferase n=1 Tax=uncultured Croceitalea sp. TaxID=1798908 RepID=UPI0033065856